MVLQYINHFDCILHLIIQNMELFFFMFVLLNSYGILAFNDESLHLRSNENANIDRLDDESNNRGGKRK